MTRPLFFGLPGGYAEPHNAVVTRFDNDPVGARDVPPPRRSPRSDRRTSTNSGFEPIRKLLQTAASLVPFFGASVLVRWQAHHVRLGRVDAKRHWRKTPQGICEQNKFTAGGAPADPNVRRWL
jgi:hypothetical protein